MGFKPSASFFYSLATPPISLPPPPPSIPQGDITRYGERKISGMMKDGYNSAHRYYINIFRDSYRQVLIGKGSLHSEWCVSCNLILCSLHSCRPHARSEPLRSLCFPSSVLARDGRTRREWLDIFSSPCSSSD